MRTPERSWHLRLWVVIGPLCLVALILALVTRPRAPGSVAWPAPTAAVGSSPVGGPADAPPAP